MHGRHKLGVYFTMESIVNSFKYVSSFTNRHGSDEIGWGPVWFQQRRDLRADFHQQSIALYLCMSTLGLTFILGVLTARRRRVPTLILGTLVLTTTFVLIEAFLVPEWYVGQTKLTCSYCIYKPHLKVKGSLGLHVGLDHFNITFIADDLFNVYFNDEFPLTYGGRRGLEEEYRLLAIQKGLPNPVITVAEYLDQRGGAFQWGASFSAAGYFTSVILCFAMTTHSVSLVLLVLIPSHGLRVTGITGLLMMTATLIYATLLPSTALPIFIDGVPLQFGMGRCFISVFVLGLLNSLMALSTLILRNFQLGVTLSTFLELNYDTPWDNKKLKADSEARREANLTRLFVDSRLRPSIRRFRNSFRHSRRSKSQDPKHTFDVEESRAKTLLEVTNPCPMDQVDLIPAFLDPNGHCKKETSRSKSGDTLQAQIRVRSLSEIKYTDEINAYL
ncbi:dual oxidase maturation factor 1-like [Tigriopus californicus]|uniref:dual oxidase maturation factor 1-like n=1 Tax=Tigriopus californicus TaxID=6832 RepID=UPI0027DA2D95|nr:dual oxidase maturation factor 1-like [Tigriopus californicus]|eukprot:TCALIF_04234-PA protein Name:"Similar to C06E1.3 DUOXA-like protein C06E1.3 (Caenorhabditis elegans)" AED:0.00 eAED:0.00 QI:16/1/1/1/0/0/2/146/444